MLRGYYHLVDSDPVFADEFGAALTSRTWQRLLRSPALRRLVIDVGLRPTRRAAGTLLGRARYLEDRLDTEIARGCSQYVIVGAGMDSFALRRPDLIGAIRVIELDHPSTQAVKRERVDKARLVEHLDVEYVPVDFNAESIATALGRCSFDSEAITMFSWMGVSYYLPKPKVFAALAQMGACAPSGSQILFDYSTPSTTHGRRGRHSTNLVRWITRSVGEPMVSSFTEHELAGELVAHGLEMVEVVSGDELAKLFFAARADGLRPFPHVSLGRLLKK